MVCELNLVSEYLKNLSQASQANRPTFAYCAIRTVLLIYSPRTMDESKIYDLERRIIFTGMIAKQQVVKQFKSHR